VTFRANFKRGEILTGRKTGQELLLVLIEVDLVQHELACLFVVGELIDNSKVVGSHVLVVLDGGAIWF
jgi:hypothetical protein